MDELVIKEHNFVTAKNKIQEFVSKAPTDISLPRVREDNGLFGDHKVRGTEFNQCVGQVQKSLISLNGLTKTIISEFKEVYKAFEALDKDYISGIVIAVNAAKKASDDAKKVSDQNKKTIEALQKTVEKLRGFENEVRTDILAYQEYKVQAGQFTKNLESQIFRLNEYKNLLDSYSHLKDVDEIWSDLQLQKSEIGNQKKSIDGLSVAFRHSVDGLSDQIKDVSKRIDQFFEETDATIAHIRDDVKSLADYSDKLKSYGHLSEIDTIWEDLDGLKTKHNEFRKDYELFSDCMTTSFSSLSENVGVISSEVTRHHDKLSAIDSELKAIKDKIDSEQLKLSRRVRVNHIIAALSIVLIITLFVLDILKVI